MHVKTSLRKFFLSGITVFAEFSLYYPPRYTHLVQWR